MELLFGFVLAETVQIEGRVDWGPAPRNSSGLSWIACIYLRVIVGERPRRRGRLDP